MYVVVVLESIMLYLLLGCVALCSWLTSFCYPGNCMDGISSCNCSQGFVGDNCLESKHYNNISINICKSINMYKSK